MRKSRTAARRSRFAVVVLGGALVVGTATPGVQAASDGHMDPPSKVSEPTAFGGVFGTEDPSGGVDPAELSSDDHVMSDGHPGADALPGEVKPAPVGEIAGTHYGAPAGGLLPVWPDSGDDQLRTTPVASKSYRGLTAHQVNARLAENNARPTDLAAEPYSGSGESLYTVTMVANTGAYAVGSWAWYTGMTADAAIAKLQALGMRPVSVSRYMTTAGWRFAMAMVANSGVQGRAWQWWSGSLDFIRTKVAESGMRMTRLRGWTNGATRAYDVLLAPATTSWWWWAGGSPATINRMAADNNARLIDLSRNHDGTWNAVFVPNSGRRPGWWYGFTHDELVRRAERYGARLLTAQPLGTTDDDGRPLYLGVLTPNVSGETALRQSVLDADIRHLVEGQGLGGVIEFRDSEYGTVTATTGVADTTSGAAPEANARYRTASVSKTFVATELLKQVDAGRVRLDSPISTYLPGEVVGGDAITVRMLLNHTSGLYNYSLGRPSLTEDPARAFTARELLAIANGHGPVAAPGAEYRYSNTNFLVAAMIVEKVTGLYYGEAIRRDILVPLGLADTSVPTTADMGAPVLHGYWDNAGIRWDTSLVNPTRWYGSGQIVTTTADANTFFAALLGGTLLSPAQMTELRTSLTATSSATKMAGLGIFRTTLSCGREIWWHDGLIQGYRSFSAHSADGTRSLTWSVSALDMTLDYVTENSVVSAAFCYL